MPGPLLQRKLQQSYFSTRKYQCITYSSYSYSFLYPFRFPSALGGGCGGVLFGLCHILHVQSVALSTWSYLPDYNSGTTGHAHAVRVAVCTEVGKRAAGVDTSSADGRVFRIPSFCRHDRRVFSIPSFCRQASVQNLQIGECSESADRRVFRIPSFRIRPIGQRSFSPTTWNRLPVSVPCAASSCSFKSSLKTILFSKSVSSVPLP